MSRTTGFSDVDASGRSGELVDYVALLAGLVADVRGAGFEMLNLPAAATALDVGCGAGEVCVDLARRVGPTGRVTGVDLSEAMIEAARKTGAASGYPIDFRVASAYRLPFPDEAFDLVRAERVFQHLDSPDKALAEMLRVTRVGGQVMLIDPDHGQTALAVDDPADCRAFEAYRRAFLRMMVNPHSGIRLRPMMERAGLSDIRARTMALELAFPIFRRAMFLDESLASAIGQGELTQQEAAAFASSLEARHRDGLFLAIVVGYTVVGSRAP